MRRGGKAPGEDLEREVSSGTRRVRMPAKGRSGTEVADAATADAGARQAARSPEATPAPLTPVAPLISVAALTPQEFRKLLLPWYRQHARDLPWRNMQDPYATWVSEIMLQQTRVATVIERFEAFMARFPTLQALAAAPEEHVLALWSGLGYYRRARMLHRGAQFVARELGGKLPRKATDLRTLPGVGEYTAAAIASIAFGESVAVVDGNVERVLLRLLGLPEDRTAAGRALLAGTAASLVPKQTRSAASANLPGEHNQAMMELGATICLPRQPLCLQCPVLRMCRTRGEHATGPRGAQTSRTVAYLLALRKRGITTEVLLERRALDGSLMPGMLELPPLPLDAAEGREPVLRVRHNITNTNYYVQVFSESIASLQAAPAGAAAANRAAGSEEGAEDAGALSEAQRARDRHRLRTVEEINEDEEVFEADPEETEAGWLAGKSLVAQVPAAARDLEWFAVGRLGDLPLTGLARKCLQRLRVMPVPALRLR